MNTLREHAGAFRRPIKQFSDIITMDCCSCCDGGMQYSLKGERRGACCPGHVFHRWGGVPIDVEKCGRRDHGLAHARRGLAREEVIFS